MIFRKLVGVATFSSGPNGEALEYQVAASAGGHTVKNVGYMIKVIQKSSGNAKCGLRLDHGPDGTARITHSTPIAVATIPGLGLVAGDTTNTSAMLMEWLHPIVIAQSADSSQQSFTAEVYEMRKPF